LKLFEAGNQLNAGILSQSASSNHALYITKSAVMIKKNALCLSQSAFGNFALYVIIIGNTQSLSPFFSFREGSCNTGYTQHCEEELI